MANKKRDRTVNSQRSIRLPETAWEKIERYIEDANSDPERDPFAPPENRTSVVARAVGEYFDRLEKRRRKSQG